MSEEDDKKLNVIGCGDQLGRLETKFDTFAVRNDETHGRLFSALDDHNEKVITLLTRQEERKEYGDDRHNRLWKIMLTGFAMVSSVIAYLVKTHMEDP